MRRASVESEGPRRLSNTFDMNAATTETTRTIPQWEQSLHYIYTLLILLMAVVFAIGSSVSSGRAANSSIYSLTFLMTVFAVSVSSGLFVVVNVIYRKRQRQAVDERWNTSSEMTTTRGHSRADTGTSEDQSSYEPPIFRHPYYFDKEGINLYLRLGTTVFSLISMLYSLMGTVSWFTVKTESCRPPIKTGSSILSVLELLHFWIQGFIIFKYHKIVFRAAETPIRFSLLHISLTNLILWIFVVVDEGIDLFKYATSMRSSVSTIGPTATVGHPTSTPSGELPTNASTPACDANADIVNHVRSYMFPFVIGSTLIGASVMYHMYCNVGKVPSLGLAARGRAASFLHPRGHSSKPDCQKARTGFFFGLLFFAIDFLMCILKLVYDKRAQYVVNHYATFIKLVHYYGIFFIVFMTICLGCVVYLIRTISMRFTIRTEQIDMHLMNIRLVYLAVAGSAFYFIFSIIPMSYAIYHSVDYSAAVIERVTIGILNNITALLQLVAQSMFICDCLFRRAATKRQRAEKPGRGVLAFLTVVNFVFWIDSSFLLKQRAVYTLQTDFYGSLAWSIAISVCLPLLIFYRFHSSVMLADMWQKAYLEPVDNAVRTRRGSPVF